MSAPIDTTFLTDSRRKCVGRADLFLNSALDYRADDEDYAHFTAEEHAAAAAAKADIEAQATDKCLDCPLMMACLAYSLANDVSGPAGGETEDARREMRAQSTPQAQQPAEVAAATSRGNTAPAVCASDRGKRNQIDDATVAVLTRAGKSVEEIAHDMQCSVRSITRARLRLRKAQEAALAAEQDAPQAEQATATGTVSTMTPAVTRLPAPTPGPDRRRVSPAMAAIYDVLADGAWHHQNDLVALGARLVSDEEAIAWWTTRHKTKIAADPTLVATTSRDAKIAYGARDKVLNALSASTRNRARTERGGATGGDASMFRSTSPALVSAAA